MHGLVRLTAESWENLLFPLIFRIMDVASPQGQQPPAYERQ